MRDRVGDEHGFSLTEVAVASALLMVLLIPMLRFLDSSVRGAVDLQASIQLHTDARGAIDQLVREVRQAYSDDPTRPALTVAPQRFTVYSPDTSRPFHLRRIEYQLVGNELQRSVTVSTTVAKPWAFGPQGPWVPVMAARTTDAFTALTAPDGQVRRLDIALTTINGSHRADRPLRTSVQLRNM